MLRGGIQSVLSVDQGDLLLVMRCLAPRQADEGHGALSAGEHIHGHLNHVDQAVVEIVHSCIEFADFSDQSCRVVVSTNHGGKRRFTLHSATTWSLSATSTTSPSRSAVTSSCVAVMQPRPADQPNTLWPTPHVGHRQPPPANLSAGNR
jgi:hypothetical protein